MKQTNFALGKVVNNRGALRLFPSFIIIIIILNKK